MSSQQNARLALLVYPNFLGSKQSLVCLFWFIMQRLLCFAFVVVITISMVSANSEIVHLERSVYRDVYVYDSGSQLCIGFINRNDQSCVFADASDYLVWEYYRASIAGLVLAEKVERVLMIGLGGGVLATAIRTVFPEVEVEVVELDPAMLKVAKEYFNFEESARVNVQIADGRVAVKRALLEGEKFDAVILDAFGIDYTPEHMLTEEFLREVRNIMHSDGVFIAHAKAENRLRDAMFNTYEKVFGQFYYLDTSGCCRLIFASTNGLMAKDEINRRALAALVQMQRLHISVEDILDGLKQRVDWDQQARILTDGHAPGNILNVKPRLP